MTSNKTDKKKKKLSCIENAQGRHTYYPKNRLQITLISIFCQTKIKFFFLKFNLFDRNTIIIGYNLLQLKKELCEM